MTVGLLVMAYGTPAGGDDVEGYYTDIRRGRPPSPEALADLRARYDAIGGTFPLRALTDAQVAGLAANLGPSYAVALGMKHSAPTIEEARETLAAQGVSRIVGLVLAPHYSRLSVGEYAARAGVDTIESWHLLPEYLSFLSDAVLAAIGSLPEHVRYDAEVLFTAHSLPERILDDGDPYAAQLMATAEAVATLADLKRWGIGWQSAGRTPEPWLGPDLTEVLRAKAEEGARAVVVCACGFVADHLEVAYDLDVEAARVAREVGLAFARTRSVNDDPAVLRGLADLVRSYAS